MAIYKNLEKFKNNIAIVLNENENVTYSRLLNDANLFAQIYTPCTAQGLM